ncbi:hypothetical protein MSA03_26350 [Microbacterium saccharophilum]|nr:hypothetical protein MSA03_26350 [Microbacterium saccharophilum]
MKTVRYDAVQKRFQEVRVWRQVQESVIGERIGQRPAGEHHLVGIQCPVLVDRDREAASRLRARGPRAEKPGCGRPRARAKPRRPKG